METKCNVMGLTVDEFDTKNGKHVKNHLLVMRDLSARPMLSLLSYLMNEDDKLAFGDGKLTGKDVNLVILDMEQSFDGKLRVTKGKVEPVVK